MLSNNARLSANIVESDDSNILEIQSGGQTYQLSDISWVFDYVGPTGIISKEGLLREVRESDFEIIVENGGNCKVEKNDKGELILHYISQPE